MLADVEVGYRRGVIGGEADCIAALWGEGAAGKLVLDGGGGVEVVIRCFGVGACTVCKWGSEMVFGSRGEPASCTGLDRGAGAVRFCGRKREARKSFVCRCTCVGRVLRMGDGLFVGCGEGFVGEFIPFGSDDNSVSIFTGLVGCLADDDALLAKRLECSWVVGFLQALPDLRFLNLGIVDADLGVLGQEVVDDGDGCALSCIAGVFLVCVAENGNFLVGEGREEALNDAFDEAIFLVFIDVNDPSPVISDFREVMRLGNVDKIENVFLEAGSTEANGRFQHT